MLDKFFACEYLEKDKSAFNGFKFEGIQYGWLGIGFYKDGQGIGLDFDECLYDPIPEMIKMCLKLKMNENFSFVLPDIGRGMSVEILSDGKVKFILYEKTQNISFAKCFFARAFFAVKLYAFVAKILIQK